MKIEFEDIKLRTYEELLDFCQSAGINASGSRKEILTEIMKFLVQQENEVFFSGFLEIVNGYGFLRDISQNFIPTTYDIYVHNKFIKEYNLKQGHEVYGKIAQPKNEEQKFFCLQSVVYVNGKEPIKRTIAFEELTATYPKEQIVLERDDLPKEYNIIARTIDLLSPIGAGQRALIVAPPKSGKTTVMHSIAVSILKGHKDIKLIILLVGERPEELTEMKKIAPEAEIVCSTFDDLPENHIKTAEMICERAKRLVEIGEKVVILTDSITRLVRSYNYVIPSSGKVLTGGVEPGALQKAKQFFGSARNTFERGSLTIIATGLTGTGSKMDDFIYEEFKGTGNSEIKLDSKTASRKIFPAIELLGSGTRRIEQMISAEQTAKLNALHSFLATMVSAKENADAIKFLIDRINASRNNKDLMVNMQQTPQQSKF